MKRAPEKRVEKSKRSAKSVLKSAFDWYRESNRTLQLLPPAIIALISLGAVVIPWWRGRPQPLQAPFDVNVEYKPGGFMGDGQVCPACVEVNTAYAGRTRAGDTDDLSIRISYLRPADRGFAGIYWLSPDGNFGDLPGRRILGASKISFWAAGESGGEVVEFLAGGIRSGKRHSDTFTLNLGQRRLEREWRRYEFDLRHADLSEVIGAFAWSAASNWNTMPLTFYLDDIQYE